MTAWHGAGTEIREISPTGRAWAPPPYLSFGASVERRTRSPGCGANPAGRADAPPEARGPLRAVHAGALPREGGVRFGLRGRAGRPRSPPGRGEGAVRGRGVRGGGAPVRGRATRARLARACGHRDDPRRGHVRRRHAVVRDGAGGGTARRRLRRRGGPRRARARAAGRRGRGCGRACASPRRAAPRPQAFEPARRVARGRVLPAQGHRLRARAHPGCPGLGSGGGRRRAAAGAGHDDRGTRRRHARVHEPRGRLERVMEDRRAQRRVVARGDPAPAPLRDAAARAPRGRVIVGRAGTRSPRRPRGGARASCRAAASPA